MDDAEESLIVPAVNRQSPLRPSQRPFRGIRNGLPNGRKTDQVIEHHRHIGSQLLLHPGRFLGSQPDGRPVVGRAERDPLVVHPGVEGEHLIAPGIGERRSLPAHEAAQASPIGDHPRSGPEHEVIRVGEHHPGPGFGEIAHVECPHRAAGPHRHERRSSHPAVGSGQHTATGRTVARLGGEGHGVSHRSTSMASPKERKRYPRRNASS